MMIIIILLLLLLNMQFAEVKSQCYGSHKVYSRYRSCSACAAGKYGTYVGPNYYTKSTCRDCGANNASVIWQSLCVSQCPEGTYRQYPTTKITNCFR